MECTRLRACEGECGSSARASVYKSMAASMAEMLRKAGSSRYLRILWSPSLRIPGLMRIWARRSTPVLALLNHLAFSSSRPELHEPFCFLLGKRELHLSLPESWTSNFRYTGIESASSACSMRALPYANNAPKCSGTSPITCWKSCTPAFWTPEA